ncbi:hypothetical protein FSARC_4923 [Fusarium sarcochroum]|uniref:Xylanolytic transcriptional activator regulatory domain-containing protein n=1 Tax=Fusarium sarcochroum TaxID=1208366 RepID=A0A8H4U106_9HYPO|nr:hypothetical protein FSARC_4923 [Fusarium sarcochroum]
MLRIDAEQPPLPTVRTIDTATEHPVPSNHSSPASTLSYDPTRFETVGRDVIRNYLDAFFDKANYFLCPFLHKATVIADFCQDKLEPKLIKAICALGIRLSSSEPNSCCYDWMDEVQRDIVTNMNNVSLTDLQALMLVIQFRSLLKFTDDVWNLLSIAARVAFTKRFNYERPKDDPVKQESLRRLMWSIFIMDKDFSGGIEDLTICPVYRLHIRLPNSNHNFQLGLPSRMQYSYMCVDDAVDTNATSYLIKMFDLRDRILSSSSETAKAQKRVHLRSNYVFAPEGEEESDSAANPLVVEPGQAWPTIPPPITVPSTDSWPFSLPDGGEDSQSLAGANVLNLPNVFVPGAPGFNTTLHNNSFSIPTDPLDLQINAYSNI